MNGGAIGAAAQTTQKTKNASTVARKKAANPKLILPSRRRVFYNLHMTETELDSLSLIPAHKIELFLVCVGQKPVCAITISEDTPQNHADIRKFAEDNNHHIVTKNKLLFISKDKQKATKASTLLPPKTLEETIELGGLFGYPKDTSIAYYNRINRLDGDKILDSSKYYQLTTDHPEVVFAGYRVREDHVNEDLQTARDWMEICKKEIPNIANRASQSFLTYHQASSD